MSPSAPYINRLRCAAVVAAVTGMVLVPAAAAVADPASSGSQTASPAPSTPSSPTSTSPTPGAASTSTPSSPASTSPTPGGAPTSAPSAPTPDSGTLIRTDTLKGGLIAKVYRHGDAHIWYTADVFKNGRKLGSLRAGAGYPAEDSRDFGVITVTLTFQGQVRSVAYDHGSPGQGPITPVRCVVTLRKSVGAGTAAFMTISPSGPSVLFRGAGDNKVVAELDRLHPKLPTGFVAEILNPSSSQPQLLTNMEGGGHPASVNDFPALPQGCSFAYQVTTGAAPAAAQHQTTVVPQGSVAAGIEEPAQSDERGLIAALGSAAAVAAAGLGLVIRRRRLAATNR